jgi:hypothetical protein
MYYLFHNAHQSIFVIYFIHNNNNINPGYPNRHCNFLFLYTVFSWCASTGSVVVIVVLSFSFRGSNVVRK